MLAVAQEHDRTAANLDDLMRTCQMLTNGAGIGAVRMAHFSDET